MDFTSDKKGETKMKSVFFVLLFINICTVNASDLILTRGIAPFASAYSVISSKDNCSNELIQKIIYTANAALTNNSGSIGFYIANVNMPENFTQDFYHSFDCVKREFDKTSFVRCDDENLLRKVIVNTYANMSFFQNLNHELNLNSLRMQLVYPFEHISLTDCSCMRWSDLVDIQHIIHPKTISVLVYVSRIITDPVPGITLTNAVICGKIRPVITNSLSFEPIDASYDLMKILGIVYTNKHIGGVDGYYALIDSHCSRINTFNIHQPNTIIVKSISGNGSIIGYDEYDNNSCMSAAHAYNGDSSFSLFASTETIESRVTDLSFDGNSIICDYLDCKKYPGPRTALYSQSVFSILTPFDSDSDAAVSCSGKFISSNGCVVAGTAFDVKKRRQTAFIKREGEKMIPLSGPVLNDDFLCSEVLAMSRNGHYVVGKTAVNKETYVFWTYDGHDYRKLMHDLDRIESINPCCISDAGDVIFGMATTDKGFMKPFMITGGRIGIIETGNEEVAIIDVVSSTEDGRIVLCKAFKKDFGEIGVYIDIIRVE